MLTRAAKQEAVREMARRLATSAIISNRFRRALNAEDHARTLRRRHDALVRLAMARTCD